MKKKVNNGEIDETSNIEIEEKGEGNVLETSVEDIAKTFAQYRYMMLDIEGTNKFLEAPPSEQVTLGEMYPKFMNAMVSQAIEKYLNEKNMQVLMEKNYRYGEREEPVGYRNMEIGRGKSRNLIEMGYLYAMSDTGIKVVIVIDFIHYMSGGKLEIIFKKEDMAFFEDVMKLITTYIDEFDYFRGEKISMSGRLLEVGNYGWDDIVLENGVREDIENNVISFFNRREIYEKNNVPFKRGVILEGPPGTGKTLISKILVNKVNDITFILATAADIEEAPDIANLFSMARRYAPTIVFMEDIDFFAQNRSESNFARITGELLAQLDGIEDNKGIVVVATTNHKELLDEAIVRRPGRFDVMLHIGELGIENRLKLLCRFLSGRQITADVNLRSIAERCENFTGSHMKELSNSVCISAINSNSLDDKGYIILLNEHFDEAIARIQKHCLLESKDSCVKECAIVDVKDHVESKPSLYYRGFNGFLFKKEKN